MKRVLPEIPEDLNHKFTAAELKRNQMAHPELIALMQPGDNPLPSHLGHAKAIVIVCAAANTSPTNLSRTLTQLGVNPVSFQESVFDGVVAAGYTIDKNNIPDAPDTALIDVVTVIQNARANG